MNINKIILMGRLTADPEMQMSRNNVPVLRFTVAVNRPNRSKNDSGDPPTADFIDCVCFNKTAEHVQRYFRKGSVIIVFGSLQIDVWKDEATGQNRRSAKVIVNEVSFGESKKDAAANAAARPAPADHDGGEALSNVPDSDYFTDIKGMEDDLPF